jgi:hypothetical protein
MNPTTKSPPTPGYNCRLWICFRVDKYGRKLAYRLSGDTADKRMLRMPLVEAELFVAQDQADLVEWKRF